MRKAEEGQRRERYQHSNTVVAAATVVAERQPGADTQMLAAQSMCKVLSLLHESTQGACVLDTRRLAWSWMHVNVYV